MYCQKCGTQNDEQATRCVACGEPINQVKQAPPKKKKHGCLISVLVVIGIFVILMFAGVNDESASTNDTSDTNGAVVAEKSSPEAGKIGDYMVTIKESKIVENGEKNILVVTYSFTNDSDDSQAFMYAITDKLFQNGVELGTVYSSWGMEEEYNFDNKSKEIKPGITLDVQCAYELNDLTTNVEVEITEWISFDDKKLTYMIQLGQ